MQRAIIDIKHVCKLGRVETGKRRIISIFKFQKLNSGKNNYKQSITLFYIRTSKF